MIGEKYNRLTIISEVEPKIRKSGIKDKRFLCRCDCGNEKIILSSHIKRKNGGVKSCGCFLKEWLVENKTKHKLINTRAYGTWTKMKQRCYDINVKAYKDYGGRGIKVCDRWLNSFQNFYDDMGERPIGYSIDRINVNGNYEPSNCRWATPEQQNKNKRPK